MTRSIRATATAMTAALLASSLLAAPILAAKPTTGGGGTTTTSFAGTFSATPETTIVVGAPTRVTFRFNWTNGANRLLRLDVASSYATPHADELAFDPDTGAGAGYVERATGNAGCGANAGLWTTGQSISVSTGDCSSGSFSIDYYALTYSTGGGKFPIFLDAASTALTTLTLNASSAKVSVTGISNVSAPLATTYAAGDVVRVSLKVVDTKGKVLPNVPLTITDSGLSEFSAGSIACPHESPGIVICTSSLGTAWVDLVATGAGSHQVRGTVSYTSYSGQRSFTAAAGPFHHYGAALEGSTNLSAGDTAAIAVSGYDQYGNVLPITAAEVTAGQASDDGGLVELSAPVVGPGGVVRIGLVAMTVGTVTIDYTAGAGTAAALEDASTFTITAGALDSLVLVSVPPNTDELTAGTARTFGVVGKDRFDNTVALTTGDVDWTTGVGETGSLSFGDESAATGVVTLVVTGEHSGGVTLIASAGGIEASAGMTVVAGALADLVITGAHQVERDAGITLTVTGSDGHGNILALDGYSLTTAQDSGDGGVVSLTGSVGTGGEFTVTGLALGTVDITVSSASPAVTSAAFQVAVVEPAG